MDKRKRIIDWILLISWMLIIFLMSNQPGDISSSQSGLVLKFFSLIGIELNEYFGELATLLIRKLAHFSEYMILFMLAYKVSKYYIKGKKKRILTLIFVFLYACTDELHQHFVPDRVMSFKDVLIDTLGGGFALIIISIYEKIKYKKQNIIKNKIS